AVDIPVIASGGVGQPSHILEVFEKTDVSAALAASIFHFNQYSIGNVKNYLQKNDVAVRL
ncbi:MAG: imidazole glycerol phosphate synthase subunit HisF, partial [Methanobrevibacter sp.]|nr:imidazole glycerol phosphate synthase subunit HisF [Methanobrevibacter sp.]